MRPPSLNLRPRGTGTHIVRNGDVAGGDRAAPELAMVDWTDHLAVKLSVWKVPTMATTRAEDC